MVNNLLDSEYPIFFQSGFFAAHIVTTLVDSPTFTPLAVFTNRQGETVLHRLVVNDDNELNEVLNSIINENSNDSVYLSVLRDTLVHYDEGSSDAITIIMYDWTNVDKIERFTVVIPYSQYDSEIGFKIFDPTIIEYPDSFTQEIQLDGLMSAFFEGVGNHVEGSQLWTEYNMT